MDKLFQMLCLAQKAGKAGFGEDRITTCVQRGKAQLVVVASDCSDNTKKHYYNLSSYYSVRLIEYGQKSELGSIKGKKNAAAVCINDENFARCIVGIFEKET